MSDELLNDGPAQASDHEWLAEQFALLTHLPPEARLEKLDALSRSNPSAVDDLRSLLDNDLDSNAASHWKIDEKHMVSALADHDGFQVGDQLGDFKLEEQLGQGAFGSVFRARQISLGRTVALKITPNLGTESRTLAPLDHPHIVRIFSESRLDAGNRLLCLHYVPGLSLEALLKRLIAIPTSGAEVLTVLDSASEGTVGERDGLLPSRLRERTEFSGLDTKAIVLSWMGQIASALAYAHNRGVLHLDVKPGNILIDLYGKAWLTDFNIAFEKESPDSHQTLFGGTEAYMPPEQKESFSDLSADSFRRLSPASDVYALARVTSELVELWNLTGRLDLECHQESLSLVPTERACADQWAVETRNALRVANASNAAGPAPFYLDWMGREPRTAAVLAVLIPQFIGSLVNILYNGTQIVDWLNASQRQVFGYLCLVYNPVIFALGTWLLFPRVMPLFRTNKRVVNGKSQTAASYRKIALSHPFRTFFIPCCLWSCSFIVFPFGIHFLSSPLPSLATYGHFFVSFFLSALVSGTYSYLATSLLMIRYLYPKLWWGKESLAENATRDLESNEKTLRLFCWSAGALPIFGAALFIFLMPTIPNEEHYWYRWLTLILMVLGILGFGLSIRVQNYLERFIEKLKQS